MDFPHALSNRARAQKDNQRAARAFRASRRLVDGTHRWFLPARSAGQHGNREAALPFLAAALTFEPHQPDWLALVDRLLSDGTWAHRELAQRPGLFFGLVALRARLRLAEGAWTEAVAALLEVASFREDVDYLRWVPLTAEVLGSLALGSLGPRLASFVKNAEELSASDARRGTYKAVLALLRGLRGVHPSVSQLGHFEGLLLQRLGRLNEAVELAEGELARAPSWTTATAAAQARRRASETALERRHFLRALELDPTRLVTHLDVADIDLEEGRFQDAASHDDVLLRGDAEHAWAWPSWLYCRARLGDESAAEALGELARDASSSERARELGKRWTDAARR